MKKLEKGFTLIELMIVVAIIAILAAVAAPRFGAQIKKAQDAKALSIVGNWRSASNMYYSDKGDYAPTATAFSATVLGEYVDAQTKSKTTGTTNTATVTAGAVGTGTTLTMTYGGSTSDGAITLPDQQDAKKESWLNK